MTVGRNARSVWKFEIVLTDEFTLSMPKFAKPLYVAVQDGKPCLWALVDPGAEREDRTFYVHGTGHPVPAAREHIGSFMLHDGAFVGHLFQPGSLVPKGGIFGV